MFRLLIVCLMNTANPYCPPTPPVFFPTQQDCEKVITQNHWDAGPGRALLCEDGQASPMDKLRQAVDAVKVYMK